MPGRVFVCIYVCSSTMGIVRVWICEVPEGHARTTLHILLSGINLAISMITDTIIVSALENVNNSVLGVLGRKGRGMARGFCVGV